MITKEMAMAAHGGVVFYHVSAKNADGTPARARVNGVCQTWVRSPNRFKLPMKHGLYECFYLTETNANEWCASEPATLVEGP